MNPIKRALNGVAAMLNFLLPKQTGYVSPPPMDFYTRQGNRIPCESKHVMRVLPETALPEGVNASNDNLRVYNLSQADPWGYELGDEVIVCYDTALGYTAVRAKVVLRDEKEQHEL